MPAPYVSIGISRPKAAYCYRVMQVMQAMTLKVVVVAVEQMGFLIGRDCSGWADAVLGGLLLCFDSMIWSRVRSGQSGHSRRCRVGG